ncbi:MAG TPA: AmmeMemoRadiSam system protein B [Chloroflexi bacterium]|nr:MAG: AmmeMemoRadiSam system protein B [Chloroflexota bacterium]HDD56174.1 AmmeMemoRadiSam system protein B [Chloroflexota bacterium]
MKQFSDIRPSPLAGRWYPANPKRLAESVDGYISQAQVPELSGKVAALISPHAGHLYSGPVAGYAFKTLQGRQADLVVILSPFHQLHPGEILTTGHDAYQTPLGDVPVDRDSLEWVDSALRDRIGTGLTQIRNDPEHAVEILLPFFQRTFPDGFQLLPLMIRDQAPSLMRALGSILAALMSSRGALLAASTDLSHFHPAAEARMMDQTIIDRIQALDPEGLYQVQQSGTGSACGLGPLAAVLWATSEIGPVTSKILNYAHSGDITGDNASVVGYTSGVLIRD